MDVRRTSPEGGYLPVNRLIAPLAPGVVCASDLRVLARVFYREGTPEAMVGAAKTPLRDLLMDRAVIPRVPEGRVAGALMVYGEALANFMLHTRAERVRVYCRLLPGRLSMLIVYQTPTFDTDPPPADPYAEHGRGLRLMRLVGGARFRFLSGRVQINMDLEW